MSRVHRTTRLSDSKTDPGVVFSVKLTNAHETNHKNDRASIVRTCHFSRARVFIFNYLYAEVSAFQHFSISSLSRCNGLVGIPRLGWVCMHNLLISNANMPRGIFRARQLFDK